EQGGEKRERDQDEEHAALARARHERGEKRRHDGEPVAAEQDRDRHRGRRADRPIEKKDEAGNRDRRHREKEQEIEQGLPGDDQRCGEGLAESERGAALLLLYERPRQPRRGREEEDDPEQGGLERR